MHFFSNFTHVRQHCLLRIFLYLFWNFFNGFDIGMNSVFLIPFFYKNFFVKVIFALFANFEAYLLAGGFNDINMVSVVRYGT